MLRTFTFFSFFLVVVYGMLAKTSVDDDGMKFFFFTRLFVCRIVATLGISRACVPMTRRNMAVAMAAVAAADTWRAHHRRVAD
jgi:hypothetical protein